MNRRLYALHRWVSAVALIQLAAWTLSGLFFAVVPAVRVKGAPVEHAHERPLSSGAGLVSLDDVLRVLEPRGTVSKLTVASTPSGVFYTGRVGGKSFRLDAKTGADRAVDEAEARAIASRDQPGMPEAVGAVLIDGPTELEYRGKALPAWRVLLADDRGTAIYVDAITGEVTARRNDVWRVYDFLWALHIMDYRERESFRHPLLIGAAALGLLTVASGGVLWLLRARRWWRGRVGRKGT